MKAHAILQNLPADSAGRIFQYLHASDRPAYRACVELLCNRRKFRPVVVERKTLPERHAWLRTELSRKSNDDIATEILQTWLLGSNREMVLQFLDALQVPHDGNGLLETLPPEPAPDALLAAVDGLFQSHPAEAVSVYLHLFSEMDIADWPGLRKLLAEDPRLCPAPQPLVA